MKTLKTSIKSITFAVCALLLTSAMCAVAQDGRPAQGKTPKSGSMDMSKTMQGRAKAKPMMGAGMMADCQEMKQQKQKMAEDMKAQDTELTAQLATMNGASGDEKMRLMAAALTQMAEQRISMDARKAKMEEEMMKHMMQHMQMGKESMGQCPMMKEMKGMKGMNE